MIQASLIAQLVKNCLQCRRPQFNSWVRKTCGRRDRLPTPVFLGFPCAQPVKNPPAMQETWVRSLRWEDPLRRQRLPTPVFWPGEFHGLYSLWGCKESDETEQRSLSLFTMIHFLRPGEPPLKHRATQFFNKINILLANG